MRAQQFVNHLTNKDVLGTSTVLVLITMGAIAGISFIWKLKTDS